MLEVICVTGKKGTVICDDLVFAKSVLIPPSEGLFWVYLSVYVILAIMAGVFSGLTIGLLSLDALGVRVVAEGSSRETERWAAKKIYPLVERHHYVLAALVLGASVCLVGMPMFMKKITDEFTSIVLSVTLVLFLGEIFPQALCSRHGLIIAGYSYWFVLLLVIIFSPIVIPVGFFLDKILGHERDTFYGRRTLKALVSLHGPQERHQRKVKEAINDSDRSPSIMSLVYMASGMSSRRDSSEDIGPLAEDEVMLIEGALSLREKNVSEAMVPVNQVFMLSIDDKLNRATLELIGFKKFSRVPIYDNNRTNITKVLLIKTLLLINPEDKIVIRKLPEKHIIPADHIDAEQKQYDVLQHFQSGVTGHLAVVVKHSTKADGSLSQEAVGIVTLEDILEELLQEEIYDEMDNMRSIPQPTSANA